MVAACSYLLLNTSMGALSSSQKRILYWILILTFVSRFSLAFRSEARIDSRPYFDDTFYVTSIAWHLAHGDGMTADGKHFTNGIQPLIAFLYVPIFYFSPDKLTGLRLTILLNSIIEVFSVYVLAQLVARLRRKTLPPDSGEPAWRSAPIIAAALWMLLFNLLRQTMNGLETGLYSFLILLSFLLYQKLLEQEEAPISRWMLLGVTLGFLVLARIDAVFIIGCIVLYEFYRASSHRFRNIILLGGLSFLVSSPWWLYNYFGYGSLMPISGQAESLGKDIIGNINDGTVALTDMISAFFYFPYQDLSAELRWSWCLGIPALALFIIWRFKLARHLKERFDFTALRPLMMASIVFIVYYVFFFAARWFLYRYFQPISILWTILFACALPIIIHGLALMKKAPRIIWRSLFAFVLIIGMIWNVDRYLVNFVTTNYSSQYLVGVWAREHPNVRIGMEQSGIAGFMAPNITNLDGKVNSEALVAKRAGQIGRYVVKEQFDYIIDWDFIAGHIAHDAERFGGKYELDGSIKSMLRFRRTDLPPTPKQQ
jgi:hypothetical protein